MDNINTLLLERLTHDEARRHIQTCPAIIIPLGGCEPFGRVGALGAETVCVDGVAKEVSTRCKVLTAPSLPFACSTPFISFAGAAGVKPRTFVNMLCEIIHGYVFQGVVRIFLINAAPFNKEPAGEAALRVEGKYNTVKVVLYDINAVINDRAVGFDRDDGLILSLLAYLRPDMYHAHGFIGDDKVKSIEAGQYRTWRKRGRDPEKLRKMCSDGLLLRDGDVSGITAEQGEKYFGMIVDTIRKGVQSALGSLHSPQDSGGKARG